MNHDITVDIFKPALDNVGGVILDRQASDASCPLNGRMSSDAVDDDEVCMSRRII